MMNAALKDKRDERDYILESLGTRPLTDQEWKDGFDIEKKLGYMVVPVKDQKFSYSCVGQAYAYYTGVKNSIKSQKYKEVSAKSIYSLITLGFNKGAYLRDGAKSVAEIGALWEEILSSASGIESDLIDKSWFTPEMKELMAILKAHDYYRVTDFSIDGFARAIRDGDGMVAGVTANNNGTWFDFEPKPPLDSTPQNQLWGHAMYFGKFGTDSRGKYVEALNSWGKNTGNNGWQKLREEWFNENGKWVFNPWVLIYKLNNMSNESAKVLKDKNSKAVGIWLPAISEAVMKSYCLNMGITVPYDTSGNIDWTSLIKGEFELK